MQILNSKKVKYFNEEVIESKPFKFAKISQKKEKT